MHHAIIMMYNTVSSVVIVLYSIYMQLLMRVSHIMICMLAFSYFTRNTNLGEISSHGNVKRMKYITVYDKYWHSVALAEKVKMILELSRIELRFLPLQVYFIITVYCIPVC